VSISYRPEEGQTSDDATKVDADGTETAAELLPACCADPSCEAVHRDYWHLRSLWGSTGEPPRELGAYVLIHKRELADLRACLDLNADAIEHLERVIERTPRAHYYRDVLVLEHENADLRRQLAELHADHSHALALLKTLIGKDNS